MTLDPKEVRTLVERLTGYTPGPWLVRKSLFEVYNVDHGVLKYDIVAGNILIAALYTDDPTDETACLIAAAPELHSHLTAALDENERLRALMRRAHTLMRECGWHLAPASDLTSGDGVLELAVYEVEDEFRTALERKEGA